MEPKQSMEIMTGNKAICAMAIRKAAGSNDD